MTDCFQPQPNGRRAMSLAVAMIVAADGRYTSKEAHHISVRSLSSINDWGLLSEKKYSLKQEPEVTSSEFLLILDACARRIELTSGPDGSFVQEVLAVVTETPAQLATMQLMQEAAVSDGLDERNEKGILVHAMQAWNISSADLGGFQKNPEQAFHGDC